MKMTFDGRLPLKEGNFDGKQPSMEVELSWKAIPFSFKKINRQENDFCLVFVSTIHIYT